MDDQKHRFFVLVKLGGNTPIRERIASVAPKIQDQIKKASKDEFQLAFTSDGGDSFGFVLCSTLAARQIMARLKGGDDSGATLLNDDTLLVIELGDDFSGYGFSKAWTWLQHH